MRVFLESVKEQLEEPWILAAAIFLGSVLAAWIAAWIMRRVLGTVARKTKTDLDDRIIEALNRPVFMSVIFYGLSWIADVLPMPHRAYWITYSILKTLAVWVWAVAGFRIAKALLETVSQTATVGAVIQERTVPVFTMIMKVVVVAVAIYFIFISWGIDLTAWMASAGIIGIAVGFAAKDTLANLFSGLFIIADAPYQIGDYIVLDDGLRGQVTAIGIRSTRILTRDDVEITVPNAVISNSKIVNEAGGPLPHQRVRIAVDVAYGSDIDRAREVLLTCADAEGVVPEPKPRVRFRRFGASGLEFELLCWIEHPEPRGRVTDKLNCKVYKKLNEAGIEIPYSKHDVYIKEMAKGG